MSRVYDSLMKSGKFTAAQNKAESGEFVDSISELVAVCEKEGFIPRYYVDKPQDRVDETLQDMKNYTYSLVNEEMNLGNLIENALQEMVRNENQAEEDIILDADDATLESVDQLVQDDDFIEYSNFLEDERDEDEKILEFLKKEGKEDGSK